jgi:hypothetical protein
VQPSSLPCYSFHKPTVRINLGIYTKLAASFEVRIAFRFASRGGVAWPCRKRNQLEPYRELHVHALLALESSPSDFLQRT